MIHLANKEQVKVISYLKQEIHSYYQLLDGAIALGAKITESSLKTKINALEFTIEHIKKIEVL